MNGNIDTQSEIRELSNKLKMKSLQNRQQLSNILLNVRKNEKEKIHKQIEARDLEHELIDLRKMKGKLEFKDREKELEEIENNRKRLLSNFIIIFLWAFYYPLWKYDVIEQINQYNEDENYKEEDEIVELSKKIERSPYLNVKSKERIDASKHFGERKASFQNRINNLLDKKSRINLQLKQANSVERPKNVENRRNSRNKYDYLSLKVKNFNKSANEGFENSIQATREKIDRLVKEK